MASVITPHMVKVLQSSRKFWRWALASSFSLPQNGQACTMFMRLDFSSKFTSPTSTLGPVAILAAEGTEKSRRVFSAMSSEINRALGSWLSCRLRDRRSDDARSDPSHELLETFNKICRQIETRHTLPCFHPIRRKQKDKHIGLYKQ